MIIKIVITITLIYQMMIYGTRPLVSLYASDMGASTFDIGLLTATFSFIPLLFTIKAGKIADQLGDRLPVVCGSFGLALGMGAPYVFHTIWALYLSQALVGVAHIFMNISLQNVIGNKASKAQRNHYYNLFSLAISVGGLIGPIVGGYISEQFSFQGAFLSMMMIGILPILFSFCVPNIIFGENKKEVDQSRKTSFALLQNPVLRKALATSALVLYSRDIYVAYFPLYAAALGISTTMIGSILTAQGLAMVIIRAFLTKLTERFGGDMVLHLSINAAGLAFILTPVAHNVYFFILLSVLMGAGLGSGQPLSMTTTYNSSPRSRTGEVLGLRLMVNRLSQSSSSLLFGLIGTWGGVAPIFYISGLFLIGGSYYTKSKRKTIVSAVK